MPPTKRNIRTTAMLISTAKSANAAWLDCRTKRTNTAWLDSCFPEIPDNLVDGSSNKRKSSSYDANSSSSCVYNKDRDESNGASSCSDISNLCGALKRSAELTQLSPLLRPTPSPVVEDSGFCIGTPVLFRTETAPAALNTMHWLFPSENSAFVTPHPEAPTTFPDNMSPPQLRNPLEQEDRNQLDGDEEIVVIGQKKKRPRHSTLPLMPLLSFDDDANDMKRSIRPLKLRRSNVSTVRSLFG